MGMSLIRSANRLHSPYGVLCNFEEPLEHPEWPLNNEAYVYPGAGILEGLYLLHIATLSSWHGWLGCYQLLLIPTNVDGQFRRISLACIDNTEKFNAVGDWAQTEVTMV
jgi:hypothetical protein